MSIKTLRKRIALVAVSALGVGLLSVAPASAGAILVADVTISDAGQTSGVCASGTSTSSATPRYIAVGGRQDITISTNADGYAVITGGAKWISGSSTDVINSTQKKLTLNATGTNTLEVTAAGPFNVAYFNDSDTSVETHYFIAVASCGAGYSAATSYAQINDATSDTATSNIDASADLVKAYDTTGVQSAYLDLDLNDAYGVATVTTGVSLIATATGGCTLNWDTSATTGTAVAVDTAAASNDTEDLVILGDNTPRTCRVTVTFGADTVADKTVSFRGDAASISVSAADSSLVWGAVDGSASGATTNADALFYTVKDSAGGVIVHSALPTLSSPTGGFAQCTLADGTYGRTSSLVYGGASVDAVCSNATVFGAGEFKLKIVRQSDGVAVYSDLVKATMSKTLYTFEAAWDKASYNVGDIMTLTITGKDSGGRVVRDYATLADVEIAVGGASTTVAPTEADYFINGVKKYKYIAGTTAAAYGWTVSMTSGSAQAALVGNYTITNPASGVSNAEVLAAIVKLIASINKQIKALQKSLKR